MSESQLQYLQMKEQYLSLKNEMGAYDDLEGQGFLGKMRRGFKSAVGNKVSGPISVAIDFYKKIFKTQKITSDTKRGTAKVHNNLKIKYFDARRAIEEYEQFIDNIKSLTPSADMPDKDMVKCLKDENKVKMFKKKYPKLAYQIVFIYPYERAVHNAIKNYKSGGAGEVSKLASELMSAYGVLSGYNKGANVTDWKVFLTKALKPNQVNYESPDFYMWKALSGISEIGVELYTITQQMSDSEKAQYEGALAKKEARKGRSRYGLSFSSPVKLVRKGGAYDSDSDSDSDDFDYDEFTGADDLTGGYSDDDEDYYIY